MNDGDYFRRYPLDNDREIRIALGAVTKGTALMTIEQQESLTRELDGAMQSGDAKRITSAQSNILLAVMDCQRKTSERVKRLGWKFTVLITSIASSGGYVVGNWDVIKTLLIGH